MYKKGTLSSIPETEAEDEVKKWVPKKKHEVLKAKYKCLKKLFQIYDASVIGMLPTEQSLEPLEETKTHRRLKRSYRTKTDACAGTNEFTSGDNTYSEYDNDNSSVATETTGDLKMGQSCVSTKLDSKADKFAETITTTFSEKNFDTCNCQMLDKHCQRFDHLNCHLMQERLFKERMLHSYPPKYMCERRKLTRFQCFVQRLFGIRREAYKPDGMFATSDPTLTSNEKRRRRGLRFRRLRRAKKVKSETALRDLKNPSILSYVQSVQRNCLMDTTPRKCPINGCDMVSYGIINYNDHLNLCHFKDRKFICHYCHEGFETEYDKVVHENEHIGINKLGAMSSLSAVEAYKIASNTQTDSETKIPEEKLKKIVSFFDKINDPDQIITGIKKNHYSETNLTQSKTDTGSVATSERSNQTNAEKGQSVSCCKLRRTVDTKLPSTADSDVSSRTLYLHAPHCCRYCGESFTCKRQLSLHINNEHRVRYTKFHSCVGIGRPQVDMLTEDGSINIQSDSQSASYVPSVKRVETATTISQDASQTVSRRKSDESLTNIVYNTSSESFRKSSTEGSVVSKVRSYRWVPGTKIIRV